jgi:hypothetical protein
MEDNVKVLPPEAAVERLLAIMDTGAAAPLVISGYSMSPFLVHGRDTVYLSKLRRPVNRGDMILYRRQDGTLILHRVWGMDARGYSLLGDAQTHMESGVREDQFLAMVTAVNRKGKLLTPKSLIWLFFEKVWLRVIPLRRSVMACYDRIMSKRR